MPSSGQNHLELLSAAPLGEGHGYRLELADASGSRHCVELSGRTLQRLVQQLSCTESTATTQHAGMPSMLFAYPVTQWDLVRATPDLSVAFSVRTDQGAESAFLFPCREARALYAFLGSILAGRSA